MTASGFEGGVRQQAHQPDARAAVHEADPLTGERASQLACGLCVIGVPAGAGAGEDAEPLHGAGV